jgi:hypothetical protein
VDTVTCVLSVPVFILAVTSTFTEAVAMETTQRPAIRSLMNMERKLAEEIDVRGQSYAEHPKPRKTWPRTEPGPTRWEAGDQPTQLLYSPCQLLIWYFRRCSCRWLFALLYLPRLTDNDKCGAIGGMGCRENRSTRRKPVPSAALSTTNPTWPDRGSNPDRRGFLAVN